MAKKEKTALEILLYSAKLTDAGLQKILRKSRNLLTVDLIWPRSTIAKRTASREVNFVKSEADFMDEPWTKRILFREDVEGHCGLAVSVSESLNTENLEKFLRLAARYALKTSADVVGGYTVGIADIAAAPVDALATMAGTYPGPKTIAQGIIDLTDDFLPEPGTDRVLEIPLSVVKPRIKKDKPAGFLKLLIRAR